MTSPSRMLNPSEAARRLGVSAKALRVYEQRGLVAPVRSAAGWRAYGPGEMARAAEIIALRALGLSLGQIARVLGGDARALETALAQHQAALEERMRDLAATVTTLRALRSRLAAGEMPEAGALTRLARPAAEVAVAFDLPWPWGGERFELRGMKPLTYIVGPLGSGKTRLARCLAGALPGAAFLGLERPAAEAEVRLAADASLRSRVAQAMAWLEQDGATASGALTLLTALEADGPGALVVDMVEQGLDAATQEALGTWLRHRASRSRPLFLLTRSSAILDLGAAGPEEAIILCPANHSPPMRVAPHPGAAGYEAVATCLATPEVRARTAGVVAVATTVAGHPRLEAPSESS